MHVNLNSVLCCPDCAADFALRADDCIDDDVIAGVLSCKKCHKEYPIIGGIPRFAPSSNYAENFGFQWNRFRQTQLDSHSKTTISADRFFSQSGWDPKTLNGARVLDLGCGAGRFAEVALNCGAQLVAVDYSSAVEACKANLSWARALDVLQADVYKLPFKRGVFDFIYCFGVLQHTPEVKNAFMALPPLLRNSGGIAVDVYPRLLRNVFLGKYWLRPLTKRVPPRRLFPIIERVVRTVYPIILFLGSIPLLGRLFRAILPISNYAGVHPLPPSQLKDWAILDTFDMLSPSHDHPQSASTLTAWFEEAGLSNIEVFRAGHLVGRGTKQDV
jgi:SAM-dependent methyltransferase